MAIVVVALFLPEKNVALFLAVAVAIGIVLGGTQALSRSFFSLLIPRGREGEYFALYTPPSGAPRGSGPCCSASSSRSPTPTGRRSWP
jgi:MFS-type transporter involved in bile tolerance (Atg22 family)